MLASSSAWNKDAGIVMVMRFVLRECQLPLAWFSIGEVEASCLTIIDASLDFWQVAVIPKRAKVYCDANRCYVMRFLCNPQCVGWCVLVQYLESDKERSIN